jgi:hypothetical protein
MKKLGVLIFTVGAIVAGPLEWSDGRSMAAAVKPTCQDILAGHSYSCSMISDLPSATPFPVCFHFVTPGFSAKFDLRVQGVLRLGCTCQGTGTPEKPKFGSSTGFACTGGSVPAQAFAGKVSKSGSKITKGFANTSDGGAFIFNCTLDEGCSEPPD